MAGGVQVFKAACEGMSKWMKARITDTGESQNCREPEDQTSAAYDIAVRDREAVLDGMSMEVVVAGTDLQILIRRDEGRGRAGEVGKQCSEGAGGSSQVFALNECPLGL